jgi:hypothetical protein
MLKPQDNRNWDCDSQRYKDRDATATVIASCDLYNEKKETNIYIYIKKNLHENIKRQI